MSREYHLRAGAAVFALLLDSPVEPWVRYVGIIPGTWEREARKLLEAC